MHMADAFISPLVGGACWTGSALLLARASRRVARDPGEGRAPLMGVLGAFVFAAQMINFAIPGTGSSGHLGGGLLLAVLLGPWAAFLVMASILLVQSLFFADGGLLALGCNLLNMGACTAFLAYPLVYRPLAAGRPGPWRRASAILLAALLGLQAGALGVVVETVLSGRSALSFRGFAVMMLPIHLAIGLVEGLATWAILEAVRRLHPELLEAAPVPRRPLWRSPLALFLGLALLAGGGLSILASRRPDGLEWALERLRVTEPAPGPAQALAGGLQERAALMPDYAPRGREAKAADTARAGLLGGAATLALVALAGFLLRRRRKTC